MRPWTLDGASQMGGTLLIGIMGWHVLYPFVSGHLAPLNRPRVTQK